MGELICVSILSYKRAGYSTVHDCRIESAKLTRPASPASFFPCCTVYKGKGPRAIVQPRSWTPRTQPASITVQSDSPRDGRTTLSTTSLRSIPAARRPPFSASTASPTSGASQFYLSLYDFF
jgi:hypothetical protein